MVLSVQQEWPLGERSEVVPVYRIGQIYALQPRYTRCSLNFPMGSVVETGLLNAYGILA